MKQNNVHHNPHVNDALLTVGWVLMVPGQSMVLYSRLHLISPNAKLLRSIFWLIIVSAVVLCVPTVTLNLRQHSSNPAPYTRGYAVMEKIQMTLFTAQEIFISSVYLWETRKVMRVIFDGRTRRWMWQLVAMNVLLLFLDVGLLSMEYLNLYMIQTTFKSLVYSFKLKLEFAVLTQIVRVIKTRSPVGSSAIALPTDLEKQAGEGKGMNSRVSEVEVIQMNVPPEWRLSVENSAIVSPVPLYLERARGQDSEGSSMVSVDGMYPGRLG